MLCGTALSNLLGFLELTGAVATLLVQRDLELGQLVPQLVVGTLQRCNLVLLVFDKQHGLVARLASLGQLQSTGLNFADFSVFQSNYGQPGDGWASGDFNADGDVNFDDFLLMASQNHFGDDPYCLLPDLKTLEVVDQRFGDTDGFNKKWPRLLTLR